MLGRLNSHELRPLVDPGVFFAEKIDLSSRRNNAICYIYAISLKIITILFNYPKQYLSAVLHL
jgi:hypothetical protein